MNSRQRYRVFVTEQAERDIERNEAWWKEAHSPEEAKRWSVAVYEQTSELETLPKRFSLVPENAAFEDEVRSMAVGLGAHRGYRAVFTVNDDKVLVLRIRSQGEGYMRANDIDAA